MDVGRGFCPRGGSQLLGTAEAMPGLVAVRAGTLDQPGNYVPHIDFYTSRENSRDTMDANLPKFKHAPPPRS